MATLASQVKTDLELLIPEATLVDLTNRRDASATTTNDALLTRVAQLAAGEVTGRLGTSVDGDDVEACAIAIDLAMHRLSTLGATFTDEGRRSLQEVRSALEALAAERNAAVSHALPTDWESSAVNLERYYPSEGR